MAIAHFHNPQKDNIPHAFVLFLTIRLGSDRGLLFIVYSISHVLLPIDDHFFFLQLNMNFHADMNTDSNEISNRNKMNKKKKPESNGMKSSTIDPIFGRIQTYQFGLFTIDVSLA